MATWPELRTFIRSHYRIETDSDDFIRLLLEVNGRRTQFVYVRFVRSAAGYDWVHVESPIGEAAKLNPFFLLRQVETKVCGALSIVGDMLTVRHAVLLDDMNVEEFEVPLWSVCATADELEGSVSVHDAY